MKTATKPNEDWKFNPQDLLAFNKVFWMRKNKIVFRCTKRSWKTEFWFQ